MPNPVAGTIANIPNSYKTMYPPRAVQTMVQEDLVFRPRLTRDLPAGARVTEGYDIQFGARLSPAQNVGQIADGGNFPIPKDAEDRKFKTKPTIFAADYQIGILSRFVLNSNASAFNGGEMRRRPEETMGNLGKFIESTYVGTTGDGIRGYVAATAGAATVQTVVAQPHGVRLLLENMYITLRTSAGGSTIRGKLDLKRIIQRNIDLRTIGWPGPADATDIPTLNDPIYVTTETNQDLTALFANGLRGQVDDGTYAQFIHGLDRTLPENQKLKSVVLANGGTKRQLSEQLLIQANHETRMRASKKPSTLLLPEGQIEAYIMFVAAQRRFPAVGRQRQGKSTGYDLNELSHFAPGVDLDFMPSYDALPGEVFGLSWDAFFLYEAVRLQWLSGHDLQELIMLPGTNGATAAAAWGAYLVSIENFGTDFPLAHFVIRDLKDRLLGDTLT